jgi:hypothetical protein
METAQLDNTPDYVSCTQQKKLTKKNMSFCTELE